MTINYCTGTKSVIEKQDRSKYILWKVLQWLLVSLWQNEKDLFPKGTLPRPWQGHLMLAPDCLQCHDQCHPRLQTQHRELPPRCHDSLPGKCWVKNFWKCQVCSSTQLLMPFGHEQVLHTDYPLIWGWEFAVVVTPSSHKRFDICFGWQAHMWITVQWGLVLNLNVMYGIA